MIGGNKKPSERTIGASSSTKPEEKKRAETEFDTDAILVKNKDDCFLPIDSIDESDESSSESS